MNPMPAQLAAPARIEYLKVQNFRALRGVEFKNLTPLTVFSHSFVKFRDALIEAMA